MKRLVTLLLLAIATAACSGGAGTTEPAADVSPTGVWQLTSVDGKPLPFVFAIYQNGYTDALAEGRLFFFDSQNEGAMFVCRHTEVTSPSTGEKTVMKVPVGGFFTFQVAGSRVIIRARNDAAWQFGPDTAKVVNDADLQVASSVDGGRRVYRYHLLTRALEPSGFPCIDW